MKINGYIHSMIDELREEYPDNIFLCVPQGRWMVELWRLFEARKIPQLTELVGRGKARSRNALFRDDFGHGGEIAEREGALLWLYVLYGVDLDAYDEYSSNSGYDLKALAQKICESDRYCNIEAKQPGSAVQGTPLQGAPDH